jgi:hypothetical protein
MRRQLAIPSLINNNLDKNLFHIWLGWLHDLGGTFVPYRTFEEPKPPRGRRDQDKKPRRYELDDKKYGVRTSGAVVRLEFGE